MVTEHTGWLFDVYADRGQGAVVWLIKEDGSHHQFTQNLPVTFYVGGDEYRLDQLDDHLKKLPVRFHRTRRKHLFHGEIDVVAIQVPRGAMQRSLFRKLQGVFPDLDYYDADLALPIHYFSATETFPLAFCMLDVEGAKILHITNHDDKWTLTPRFPELRIMEIEPTSSPIKALPPSIRVTFQNQTETLSTKDSLALLQRLNFLLDSYDPDIVRTRYGDMWLFPYLFSIAKSTKFPFNPNRDKTRAPIRVEENQFESYGHLVHRDQQTLLLGRLHLDPKNSMAFKDWGLQGTYETARLSNLPIQNAARRSAGGAFIGMQVAMSLKKGILIPIRKAQRENFKTATQLIAADHGGVIFQPIVGLHPRVAEIDFFSMYPHIMTGWNISAETVGMKGKRVRYAPGIGAPIDQDQPGIVAEILKPIMEKRREIKHILEEVPDKSGYDLNYLKTAYEFIKGLGWVSYGYQGFSGNRIGSIEAHEAINAVSRDVILHAKEAAEDAGFEVLHLYVDSLFVSVGGKKANLDALLAEIKQRTGLRIDMEGILDWIAFLPSKQNERIPVPNCYFGVFEDGSLKCRGIMARRGDTPAFIAEVQMEAIHMMAEERDSFKLPKLIPTLVDFFRRQYENLKGDLVDPNCLTISQTLSRDLADFRVLTPAARAAKQLAHDHKTLRAGQNIEFVRVKKAPYALSLHSLKPDIELDMEWYAEQLLRAAYEVLCPLGVSKEVLRGWLSGKAGYWLSQDYVNRAPIELPALDVIVRRPSRSRKAFS